MNSFMDLFEIPTKGEWLYLLPFVLMSASLVFATNGRRRLLMIAIALVAAAICLTSRAGIATLLGSLLLWLPKATLIFALVAILSGMNIRLGLGRGMAATVVLAVACISMVLNPIYGSVLGIFALMWAQRHNRREDWRTLLVLAVVSIAAHLGALVPLGETNLAGLYLAGLETIPFTGIEAKTIWTIALLVLVFLVATVTNGKSSAKKSGHASYLQIGLLGLTIIGYWIPSTSDQARDWVSAELFGLVPWGTQNTRAHRAYGSSFPGKRCGM